MNRPGGEKNNEHGVYFEGSAWAELNEWTCEDDLHAEVEARCVCGWHLSDHGPDELIYVATMHLLFVALAEWWR